MRNSDSYSDAGAWISPYKWEELWWIWRTWQIYSKYLANIHWRIYSDFSQILTHSVAFTCACNQIQNAQWLKSPMANFSLYQTLLKMNLSYTWLTFSIFAIEAKSCGSMYETSVPLRSTFSNALRFFHFLPNFKKRSYFSKAWVPNNSLHQRFRHRNHLERKDISVKKLNFHQLAELMGFISAAKGWKGNRHNCFFLLEASKNARNQYIAKKRAKVQKFASKSDI